MLKLKHYNVVILKGAEWFSTSATLKDALFLKNSTTQISESLDQILTSKDVLNENMLNIIMESISTNILSSRYDKAIGLILNFN